MTETFSERLVEKTSSFFQRHTSRRSFLAKSAIVGSAVVANPVTYLLRPGTAYASLCGDGSACSSGWTAFCCTVNAGANSCPPGSFVAGWWKADAAAYCCGAARYIIDCNATVPVQCTCHCASGTCDERRVCCNQFRYGQCHQEIAAYGPVVCRIALCTPPWVYDPSCTTSSATDNRTVNHGAPCLPDTDCGPSPIAQHYAALGGATGALGALTLSERPTPDNKGRYALYTNGAILWSNASGAWAVLGNIAKRYAAMSRSASALGFPTTDQQAVSDGKGTYNGFQNGYIYSATATGTHDVEGSIANLYRFFGGPLSGLGYPVADQVAIGPNKGQVARFEHGDIYVSASTPAVELMTNIANVYRFISGPTSALGFPTGHTASTAIGNGTFNTFQHGAIYDTPTTGTQEIDGPIWTTYQANGAEAGALGLPTTFPSPVSGDSTGKVSRFTNGSIWYSPATGAHELRGTTSSVFDTAGGPTGILGYPTSDTQLAADNSTKVNYFANGAIYRNATVGTFFIDGDLANVYRFLGGPTSPIGFLTTNSAVVSDGVGRVARGGQGALYWTAAGGTHGVWGPISTKYDSLGGPTGTLGYPTSFVTPVGAKSQVTFQHGTLTYDPSTGVVTKS